jgi:hypothetical protein
VFVVLGGGAFEIESLLIDVPLSTCVVMGVISHGVRAADPFHEVAHFAVHEWARDEVPMVGHEFVTVQLDRYNSKSRPRIASNAR